MGNLKHTLLAAIATALVGSLATVQAVALTSVGANKLTQENKIVKSSAPAVLKGDGEGEYIDISVFSPEMQVCIGKDGYVLTEGGSINLRSAADIESDILDVLSLGATVKIIGIDGDWFQVEYGDYTGYVKSDFITLDYDSVKAVMLATIMYQKGMVTQNVNVRSAAGDDSVILDFIPADAAVTILDEYENGWYKIYFGKNYDIGFLPFDSVEVGDMVLRSEINALRNERIASIVKNGKITTSGKIVDVKLMPDENSDTIITLANGTNCKIISGGSNWTKIIVLSTNEIGYVRTKNVEVVAGDVGISDAKTATASYATGKGNGKKLVNQAAKYLGVKYVYGGTSPSGFDCSGLVQYCCRQLGVSVNRNASSQYSNGVAVSRSNLQEGDLIFLSKGGRISHVVIYAGNGMVIHAPRTGKSVCYQSLTSLCSSLHYVGARRVM